MDNTRNKKGQFVKGIHSPTEFKKGNKIGYRFQKGNKTGPRFQKGHKVYFSWKGRKLSEEHKEKISKTNKENRTWKREKNPSWKKGISFEPYTIDWTETLRRSIRERDNYVCQLCSQYGNTVHHINYDKKNCNPDNLITLCGKCHRKTSSNREYWQNYFE